MALDLVDGSLRNRDKFENPPIFVSQREACHLVALQNGKELFGVPQPGAGEVAVDGLAFACILITHMRAPWARGPRSSRNSLRTRWSSDLVLKKARRSRFATSERLDRFRRSENHARVLSGSPRECAMAHKVVTAVFQAFFAVSAHRV